MWVGIIENLRVAGIAGFDMDIGDVIDDFARIRAFVSDPCADDAAFHEHIILRNDGAWTLDVDGAFKVVGVGDAPCEVGFDADLNLSRRCLEPANGFDEIVGFGGVDGHS